jgi:hypothetical protein
MWGGGVVRVNSTTATITVEVRGGRGGVLVTVDLPLALTVDHPLTVDLPLTVDREI